MNRLSTEKMMRGMSAEVPKYPVSVKALIPRSEKFLFILKNIDGKTFYGLPGGLKEPGETLEDALKREVKEETGLEVEPLDVLGAKTYTHRSGTENVGIYYLAVIKGGNLRLKGEKDVEFAGYRWLGVEDLHLLWPDEYRNFIRRMLLKALKLLEEVQVKPH